MIFYIIVGFIVPWIVGIYLYFKNPKFMLIFVPIGMATAFLINDWGFNYFWKLKHSFKDLSLSALPFNLGLFPILCCLFIGTIHYKKFSVFWAFIVFTFGTTLMEFCVLLSRELTYRNGWNISLTAVSYFSAYIITFIYYKLIQKYDILN